MMDKRVVMYRGDFNGIKVGDLVRSLVDMIGFPRGNVAIVIDRVANAFMLGEGDAEQYDPILIILHHGKRHHVSVDDVEKVLEDDI